MRVQSAIRALQRQRPEKGEPWFPKGKRVFQPSWKARPTPPNPQKNKDVVCLVTMFFEGCLVCCNFRGGVFDLRKW